MIIKKEFTVKENKSFRLRVETIQGFPPQELIGINFVQECLNKDGKVDTASTYNFFMEREEIDNLIKGLSQV